MPGDSRVASKENEKIQKYQDLPREDVASRSEGCSCGSGSTGYNPEGIGETSQGDGNIC